MITRVSLIILWIIGVFTFLFWPSFEFSRKNEAHTLHIFSWGDVFDKEMIATFEKRYNCKVKTHPYNSNEELLVKLKATRGRGFDLIVPSDYAVPLLVKEGLVKKIDKSRLNFFDRLYPKLLGHSFDPKNDYSIPLLWEVMGFGVNTNFFKEEALSWKEIFDKPSYPIVMVNDPVEAISIAAYYLFGPVDQIDQEQKKAVTQLLIDQKPYVEAYVEFRADYLLATRNCHLAVSTNSYIWRLEGDVDFIRFALPTENMFFTIENIAIPSSTEKDELIYAFINYIYEKQNLAHQCNTFQFMPATLDVLDSLTYKEKAQKLITEIEARRDQRFHFFYHLLPEKEIREMWIEVKS